MHTQALIESFDLVTPLSDEFKAYLKTAVYSTSFARKDYLIKAGQICHNVFFIKKGLVRAFYSRKRKEITSGLWKENDIITSYSCFIGHQESIEFFEALERTEVDVITYTDIQYIYKHFPESNLIGRVFMEKYYFLQQQRIYQAWMQKAVERWEILRKETPDLVQRVPIGYLASYLGISRETLSRIRKVGR